MRLHALFIFLIFCPFCPFGVTDQTWTEGPGDTDQSHSGEKIGTRASERAKRAKRAKRKPRPYIIYNILYII